MSNPPSASGSGASASELAAPAGATAAPPQPPAGSVRYFVLLYTPAPRRLALAALLAIADELAAGLYRGLDHGVAHLRLQWWEDELLRFQQRTPRHPWLIGWLRELHEPLDLRPLAQAATIDLATQRLAARQELQLYAALFVSAAQLLGVPTPAPAELESLGRAVGTLEAWAAGQSWACAQLAEILPQLGQRQRAAPLIAPSWQPALAPLLVWLALCLHHWQRAQRRAGASARQPADKSATMTNPAQPGRFDGLADNFLAWRYARRAMRRRFRIDIG